MDTHPHPHTATRTKSAVSEPNVRSRLLPAEHARSKSEHAPSHPLPENPNLLGKWESQKDDQWELLIAGSAMAASKVLPHAQAVR